MVKNESNWSQAIRHFFRTTTLHGFKYLFSKSYMDRIGWFICCCASTCCAGLLCTVLWARFMEVPAVLELWDLQSEENAYQHMPVVAFCPPLSASADLLVNHLTTDVSVAEQARKTISEVLAAKPTSDNQLKFLETLLSAKNISLSELVFNHMPSCAELLVRCRWQNLMVPCERLFMKELTPWGVCCMMQPIQVLNAIVQPRATRLGTTKGLDLALNCSEDKNQGCGFFSTFEVEENVEPMVIHPGYNYFAQVRFSSVPQNSIEELVGISCNPKKDYNKANCLARCAERFCGCTNPLRPKKNLTKKRSPPCTVSQLECLRAHQDNSLCNCLPCCNKITTYVTLESGQMDVLDSALDPIYSDLNDSFTVLYIRVYINLSRIFTMNPTETWLSLLSSLGGVFNMFLGVGLFSALEILFLLIVKLPIAFNNSSDITNAPPSKF